jgi:hypothetical protein
MSEEKDLVQEAKWGSTDAFEALIAPDLDKLKGWLVYP